MNKVNKYEALTTKDIGELTLSMKLIKWISFFTGIFVTMPIVTIQVSGTHISIFSILYLIFMGMLVLLFIKNPKSIWLGKTSRLLFIWFFTSIFSSLFGLLYFSGSQEWFSVVLSYIPKIISFIILLILLSSTRHRNLIIEAFFKGLVLGGVLNILWAFIEGVVFYMKGYSLNNRIFRDYISTLPPNRQFITIVNSGGIRTPGFNYDPAHLGGIIPIICLYSIIKKKYFVIFFAIGALIFSQSTTALISTLILILFHSKKINIVNLKMNYRKLITIIAIFPMIIFILIFPARNSQVSQSLKSNIEGFSNRVSTVYVENKDTNIRMLYHIYLPHATMYSGLKTITGTGFGTASYAYVHDSYLSDKLGLTTKRPYDPESTYISYFFDTGIFGLFIYVYILIKIYRFYNFNYKYKQNLIVLSAMGGIVLSGLFYHYTLTAYQVLSIVMASIYLDTQNREVKYFET